jgi:hypothetical protein
VIKRLFESDGAGMSSQIPDGGRRRIAPIVYKSCVLAESATNSRGFYSRYESIPGCGINATEQPLISEINTSPWIAEPHARDESSRQSAVF